MFSQALLIKGQKPERGKIFKAIGQVINYLKSHNAKSVFTYNTSSDSRCLSELCEFEWYDISFEIQDGQKAEKKKAL